MEYNSQRPHSAIGQLTPRPVCRHFSTSDSIAVSDSFWKQVKLHSMRLIFACVLKKPLTVMFGPLVRN